MDEFIGVVKIFAGNFAPRGWAFCNGQLLSIAQNTAVFSLLGTTYGGDGRTTFGLPDLRGRAPIHFGQGPGLSVYQQGQTGGVETVTLLTTEIPAHSHNLNVNNANANVHTPVNNSSIAASMDINGDVANGFVNTTPGTTLNAGSIGVAGGNQPHENRSPYLTLNYIICLQGVFPSRN